MEIRLPTQAKFEGEADRPNPSLRIRRNWSIPAVAQGRDLELHLPASSVDQPVLRDARPGAPELARLIRQGCLDRGLIVELGGRDDCVVRLLPPLTITDDEADTVVDRLADTITTVAGACA